MISKHCFVLRFVYLVLNLVWFLVLNDKYILFIAADKLFILLTQTHNARVSSQSLVVCVMCSSTVLWSRCCQRKATTPFFEVGLVYPRS